MIRTSWAAGALAVAVSISGPICRGDNAMPIPAADRQAIENSLGQGVLGESLPAPVISDPSRYMELLPLVRNFRIVQGFHAGQEEKFQLLADPPEAVRKRWRYLAGEDEAGFLEVQPDGSLVLTGVQDRQSGALTRYDPAEPFLIKGMAPGTEQKLRMSVRVLDADEPGRVAHRGMLDVGYRYVGSYRLALPGGTYDALLLKSTYRGRVGPAELEDTQYRFFSPGVGLVAAIEHRVVSAFLLYRTDTTIARVLADRVE